MIDVDHVARLARLELRGEERERMLGQLEAILGYVDQLRRIDVEGVEPTAHVLPLGNVTREDQVQPSCPTEVMLANAPDSEAEQFGVPRILEE